MIHPLFRQIANDLSIKQYQGERDELYISRLTYSALGYWCLALAQQDYGVSKAYLTKRLNDLLKEYEDAFPVIKTYFADIVTQQNVDLSSIRKTYEELGYLLVDEENRVSIAKYGRGLKNDNSYLFFGLPSSTIQMKGLGIFSDTCQYVERLKNAIIRDDVPPKEYVKFEFNPISFREWKRDESIEFFDPKCRSNLYNSWKSYPKTKYTIGRVNDIYYKFIISDNGSPESYMEQNLGGDRDALPGGEYRRLLYALKTFYNCSAACSLKVIDENYYMLKLYSRLPNREAFLLKLMAWPAINLMRENEWIIPKDNVSLIKEALIRIGIKVHIGE